MLYRIKVKNFSGINDADFQFHQPDIENGSPAHSLFFGNSGSGKTSVGIALFNCSLHLNDYFDPNFVSTNFNVDFSHFDEHIAEFEFTFIINSSLVLYSYGKNSHGNIIYENFLIDGKPCISIDRRKSSIASFNMDGADTLNKDFSSSYISAVRYLAFNAVLNPLAENTVIFNSFMDFAKGSLLVDLSSVVTADEHRFRQLSKQYISSTNDINEFQFILERCGFPYKVLLNDFSGSVDLRFGSSRFDFFESSANGAKVIFLLYCLLKSIGKRDKKPSLVILDNADELLLNKNTYEWLSESVVKMPIQLILTSSVVSDFFTGQKFGLNNRFAV